MRTEPVIPHMTRSCGSTADSGIHWRRVVTISLVGASVALGQVAGPASGATGGQAATSSTTVAMTAPVRAPLPGMPAAAGLPVASIPAAQLLRAPELMVPTGRSSLRPIIVRCPSGGSITVAAWLQKRLKRLLNDGRRAGLAICGTGWRNRSKQIQLRIQNCGTTKRAIYLWPSTWCRPVTARPGSSLHERGLAVDFHSRRAGQTKAVHGWLARNAWRYGLRVERTGTEPWHYSETGG